MKLKKTVEEAAESLQSAQEAMKMEVIFKDKVAKDLFTLIISNYAESIQDLMAKLSPELKYGEVDPVISVLGDTITVESVVSDKGLVLTKHGYQKYTEVPEGDKYSTVSQGKLTVYIKSFTRDGVRQADKVVGVAPSVTDAFVDMEEHNAEKS